MDVAPQELETRPRAGDVGLPGAFLEVGLEALVLRLRLGEGDLRLA